MTAQTLTKPNVFDQWAQVYDKQPNPLLTLEERTLATLLPDIKSSHILDIGCGTGRWLQRLEPLKPASLTGIDPSQAMLQQARTKLRPTTHLQQSEASTLPFANTSKSLLLASFVLSYIDDLPTFATECARILRPGGTLLISDMHPFTAAERSWTRTFHVEGAKVELTTHHRSLDTITTVFREHGFEVEHRLEPSFEAPERPIFQAAGKLDTFESLIDSPAIYILRLKKHPGPNLRLINTRFATGPSHWSDAPLTIESGRITHSTNASSPTIDLTGYVLLPGLINAHDHLEFSLFPNLGRSAHDASYRNATEWAHEIHLTHRETIDLHRSVPFATRLWWGAIRNLLCGVTTVCHHNPHHSGFEDPAFPIHVLSDFAWAHSIAFEPNLEKTFHASPKDVPFILHAAEGIDLASQDEIPTLDRMHLLDDRTILVHGLALTPEAASLLNQRGASLITCPTSNQFLFAQSPTHLNSLDRVAIGSDSPITAVGDLLDEIRHTHTELNMPAETIYNMVTITPATILHLNHTATITPGFPADLIAIRASSQTPAATLATLTFDQIELVLLSGRVHLASDALYNRLPEHHREPLHPLKVEGHTRWLRAPIPTLVASAEAVLGKDTLRIGGKQVRYAATP